MNGSVSIVVRAAAAASLLALAACSSVSGDQEGAAGGGDSLGTKILLGNANPPPMQPAVDTSIKRDCPPIEVLEGTAAYRTYDPPGSTDPFDVRNQFNLAETARECSTLGVEAAIRVGVTGRAIAGPKGGPGAVQASLRIAVVDDQNRPLYSQVRQIQVTIPPDGSRAEFNHIEDNIVVPIPENRFRGWKILVGFDPKPVAEPKTARPRR